VSDAAERVNTLSYRYQALYHDLRRKSQEQPLQGAELVAFRALEGIVVRGEKGPYPPEFWEYVIEAEAPKNRELFEMRLRLEASRKPPEPPEEEKPWSLFPPERFREVSLQDLWTMVEVLEKDYGVKTPPGLEHYDHPGLKAWVMEIAQSEAVRTAWEVKEREKLRQSFFITTQKGTVIPDTEAIARHLDGILDLVSWNKTLYIYRDGIFIENKGEVEAAILQILDDIGFERGVINISNEVIHRLKFLHPERDYPFNRRAGLLPLQNGVLHVDYVHETFTLKAHAPEYRFTYKLPIEYDPGADTSGILAALHSWVSAQDVITLLQLPAQALLQAQQVVDGKNTTFKKAYIFEGERNSGKTTYYHLLEHVLGAQNMSDVNLKRICEDRFGWSPMEGKLVNFHDDLEAFPLRYVGRFKKLTGGAEHDIEKKGENSYKGFIPAVQAFTCNKPPEVKEIDEEAFWGRWEYVLFPNHFETNPFYEEDLFTPQNLSAFLNEVLKVMLEIARRKRLIRDSTADEVKELWSKAANALYAFVSDNTHSDQRGFIPTEEFYQAYCLYCSENALKAEGKGRVTSLLGPMKIHRKQERVRGKQTWCYKGVAWNKESPYATGGSSQGGLGI